MEKALSYHTWATPNSTTKHLAGESVPSTFEEGRVYRWEWQQLHLLLLFRWNPENGPKAKMHLIPRNSIAGASLTLQIDVFACVAPPTFQALGI
jgi:hypothetical protein